MPEWQERITAGTRPSVRVEHDVRYAAAAPLIRGADTWLDLGCGAGIAAAAALGAEPAGRAVLVDASEEALAEAARAVPARETVTVRADLAAEEGLAAVRAALGDAREGTATCFEVVEHLESFVGVVELLAELARERAFTVVLSVPNDAFWALESPWHKTMWGEGAFEELRRLLPEDHLVARQVPLQGSVLVPEGGCVMVEPGIEWREDAVPSHFLAAFGPRAAALGAHAAVVEADLAAERRWERQREANLAVYEDRLEDWLRHIHDLERRLGLPLSGQ